MTTGSQRKDTTTFGPYQLLSKLGEGGMAEVFLAVRHGPMGFRKEMAIKRIRPGITRDNEHLLRSLINEARVGGQLRHPNVVDTYEFGAVGDVHFIAMEYVEGLTLHELMVGAYLHQAPLPPTALLDLAQQICHGLEYAHNHRSTKGQPLNLVHRDLKPNNLIVSMEGQAKIMDFGIARSEAALFKTTQVDTRKGTLNYMSPEQVTTPDDLDNRSDLFTLGAILYEIICTRRLIGGDDASQIMSAIVSGSYLDRLAEAEELLPGVQPILERCVQVERDERYGSAAELERDLGRLRARHGAELGSRELMGLIGAYRDGGSALVEKAADILGRDPAVGQESPWRRFVDALVSGGAIEDDPFAAGLAPVVQPTTEASDGPVQLLVSTLTIPGDDQTVVAPEQAVPASTIPAAAIPTAVPPMQGSSPPASPQQPGEELAVPSGASLKRLDEKPTSQLTQTLLISLAMIATIVAVVVMASGPWKTDRSAVPAATPDEATDPPGEPADIVDTAPVEVPAPAEETTATPTPSAPAVPPPVDRGPVAVTRTEPADAGAVDPAEPAEPAEPADEEGAVSYVTINTYPWSAITLDGRPMGNTPRSRMEIPPGEHHLILRCGPCATSQERTHDFTIAPGQTHNVVGIRFE